ncbi:hypothetical protein FB451DRAFT_1385813 [Mycena latifolia]|nr:hypothetical protein FB451DRAFT_1385813 [Mycena latifolia]
MQVILDNSACIQGLRFRGPALIHELLGRLPEHDFSLLSSLDLDASYKWDELPESVFVTLPDEMFEARMPELRELILKDVDSPGNRCVAYRRYLATRRHPIGRPSMFFLRCCLISSTFPCLPLLAWLSVRTDAPTCTALLNNIYLPLTATLRIEPSGIHVGGDIKPMLPI